MGYPQSNSIQDARQGAASYGDSLEAPQPVSLPVGSTSPGISHFVERQERLARIRLTNRNKTLEVYSHSLRKRRRLFALKTASVIGIGALLLLWPSSALLMPDDQEERAILPPNGPTEPIEQLKLTAGFQVLHKEEKARLLRYVSGRNSEISVPAYDALGTLLWTLDADTSKPETFRKFLKEQPGAPEQVGGDTVVNSPCASYTISKPQAIRRFSFRSGRVKALKYEVRVDGLKIPVYLPETLPANKSYFHSIEEVARAMATLPRSSRNLIAAVYIEPGADPDDAYWQKKYHGAGVSTRPNYMSAGMSGVVNIYPCQWKEPQSYLAGALIHETGHILSQRQWGCDPDDSRWNVWKAAIKADVIRASQYAKASPEEDFAETFELYHQIINTPQETEIRLLLPERFKLLDGLVKDVK